MTDVIITNIFNRQNEFSVDETLLRLMETNLVKGIEVVEEGRKYTFEIFLVQCRNRHPKMDENTLRQKTEDLLNKISKHAKLCGINFTFVLSKDGIASILMEKLNDKTCF